MKILKEIKVPTGEIYTAKGDKGVLEFLTVADYGKNAILSGKKPTSSYKEVIF